MVVVYYNHHTRNENEYWYIPCVRWNVLRARWASGQTPDFLKPKSKSKNAATITFFVTNFIVLKRLIVVYVFWILNLENLNLDFYFLHTCGVTTASRVRGGVMYVINTTIFTTNLIIIYYSQYIYFSLLITISHFKVIKIYYLLVLKKYFTNVCF